MSVLDTKDPLIGKFFKACRQQNTVKIQIALETLKQKYAQDDILNRIRTPADETPLHLVVTYNPHPATTASVLLQQGSLVDARGHHHQSKTALHEASRRGDLDTVRILLAANAKVDAIKSGDWTPLMIAAAGGHVQVVKLLLQAGAHPQFVNREHANALHLAARTGSVDIVKALINVGGRNLINAKTRNGRTALHHAARAGMLACVIVLVEADAVVDAIEASGMSPLHDAASQGHSNVLEYLLECDVDFKSALGIDCGGLTILHHGAIGGYVKVIKTIVEAMRKRGNEKQVLKWINTVDSRNQTALMLAGLNGKNDVVEFLSAITTSLEGNSSRYGDGNENK